MESPGRRETVRSSYHPDLQQMGEPTNRILNSARTSQGDRVGLKSSEEFDWAAGDTGGGLKHSRDDDKIESNIQIGLQ